MTAATPSMPSSGRDDVLPHRAGTGRRPRARPARRCRGSRRASACAAGAAPRCRTTRSRRSCSVDAGRKNPLERRPCDSSRCSVCRATAMPTPSRSATRRTRERTVGAGVARDEVAERVGERLEERVRDADRQRHAERVAQASGILDRRDPRHARDRDRDRAPRRDELGRACRCDSRRRGRGSDRRGLEPRGDLVRVERPEHPQQVGDALDAPRVTRRDRAAAPRARTAR